VFDAVNHSLNFLFLRFQKSVFSSLNVASAGARTNGSDFDFDALLRHCHVSGNRGGGRPHGDRLANDCGGDVYNL
jgi:hypothetical protein